MIEISCDFCDQLFTPPSGVTEARCPNCGAVHEIITTNPPLPSQDKTEFSFMSSSEEKTSLELPSTVPQKKKEQTSEDQIKGEEFFQQATRVAAAAAKMDLSPLDRAKLHWRTYIPTIVVCGVFLTWVFFDKVMRPDDFEYAITASIEALGQGDADVALKEADRALQLKPKSRLAKSLYDYVEKRSNSLRSLNRR